MIERNYSTFSASRADDQAFLALDDVARLTEDLEDTRIIGGLMVMLLAEAFPAEGFVTRRTADADAAISVEIAQSGALHNRLEAAGYTAESGNRYVPRTESSTCSCRRTRVALPPQGWAAEGSTLHQVFPSRSLHRRSCTGSRCCCLTGALSGCRYERPRLNLPSL